MLGAYFEFLLEKDLPPPREKNKGGVGTKKEKRRKVQKESILLGGTYSKTQKEPLRRRDGARYFIRRRGMACSIPQSKNLGAS